MTKESEKRKGITIIEAANNDELEKVLKKMDTPPSEYAVRIPQDVTVVETAAFDGNTAISQAFIHDSVTELQAWAFSACTHLKSIVIPDSVVCIQREAFMGCTELEDVVIGKGVQTIERDAFSHCSSLTSLHLPASLEKLDISAFNFCSGLRSVRVDKNNRVFDSRHDCNAVVESATDTLLLGCSSTTIPSSVTAIGAYAFAGCTALAEIFIPAWITQIGCGAFKGCNAQSIVVSKDNLFYDSRENCNAIIWKEHEELLAGCVNTVIPPSARIIGEYTFWGCTELKAIAIPDSVVVIAGHSFQNCTGLKAVDLPHSSLKIIDTCAFEGCTSLTHLFIPKSVEEIGYMAFPDNADVEFEEE